MTDKISLIIRLFHGQGIILRFDCDLSLIGWRDSDWASFPLTRCSLSGWLVFLGHSHISWKTKKQVTVSRSSAEAEFRSMAAVTCELKWLKGLLSSLGVHHQKAMSLFFDCQSTLYIAQKSVSWTHQTYWNWLSLCARCHSRWYHYSLLADIFAQKVRLNLGPVALFMQLLLGSIALFVRLVIFFYFLNFEIHFVYLVYF